MQVLDVLVLFLMSQFLFSQNSLWSLIMASTSVTTVGGVMIVTQVIPKDDSSIPLRAPADPAQQAPPPKVTTPPPASGKDSKVFLGGEQQGLGVRTWICPRPPGRGAWDWTCGVFSGRAGRHRRVVCPLRSDRRLLSAAGRLRSVWPRRCRT